MQNKMNPKQLAGWLATAVVGLAMMPSGGHAEARPGEATAAAKAQTTGTTVLSLEGNNWDVAADPNNAGLGEGWWKGA